MPSLEKSILDTARAMLGQSLTLGAWGNLSARDPGSGNIYLTPSGMDYRECVEDDIVVFDPEGKPVRGRRRPSVEKEMHLLILRLNPRVNAVIHTHAAHSTVLAIAGLDLPAVTEEFAQVLGRSAPCCEYAPAGSRALAENAARALGDGFRAVILPNHGALCVGEDLATALRACGVLEKTAEVYVKARSMGVEPRVISREDADRLFEFYHTSYGQGKTPDGGTGAAGPGSADFKPLKHK
ncbi:MAG: class II aldolase/adducin family protein [Planctomycetota bacterium]|jgi:L-fuculose-phosphate aldolase|nr:class II aldolase/adducin family protein [Planctomycetota bacterium]